MQRFSSTESTNPDTFYRLKDAAKRLGISYPTLKRWIYKRKIRVARTAGGHYRVPKTEVERLTLIRPLRGKENRKLSGIDLIPARNKLRGTIISIKIEGLMAQLTLDIGGQFVTALMTRDACIQLKYKTGIEAYAIVKATEVMVVRAEG